MRRAICRAYNVFTAEQFKPYADRIIPAAIIPMYTPEEAIEELEFAAKQLGFKVIMVGGLMRRPVPAVAEEQPEAAKYAECFDVIGIDSDHDYDPVWQKCRELKLAPSFHNGARSALLRNSPSNSASTTSVTSPRPATPSARALLGGRHAALPRPELRVPRGRRRLGVHALRGPRRPLGQAQR